MWFEHFWTQCRLWKLNIKVPEGFGVTWLRPVRRVWSLGCMTAPLSINRALLKAWGCPDITPGLFVMDFMSLSLGKLAVALLAIHGGWLGTERLDPAPLCHLMGSVAEVSASGWLGSQGLRLNVYISCYNLPLPLSYFALHPFSLETNHHPESKARLFAHKVWGDPCVTPHLSCKELLFLVLHCALWGCLLPK